MTKNEAIMAMREVPCKYAILTLDVWSNDELIYPNEKVVVSVLETQDPFANIGKYYTTFESIKDFRENSVFGKAEAKKYLTRYYFGDIKRINYFY